MPARERDRLEFAGDRRGRRAFDHLDVVFSNVGISGAVAPIQDYPSDEFARTLAVHVLGAFHMLKHGAPHVRDGGSMIITSSVVGLMEFEGISGYIAAKHGQVGLMRAAAKELAARRIRVNTLHPGPTSTASQDDRSSCRPGRRHPRQPCGQDSTAPGRLRCRAGSSQEGALDQQRVQRLQPGGVIGGGR